ncbi:aminotransferase class I/II-fold pyridoxal phosphate-dependent enzyme, partial [Glaesserella parasuis]|nr:aminotransferase class I/II-fold pyridoxal phosphate-dependent enzyme [Glaesserella parasuis]
LNEMQQRVADVLENRTWLIDQLKQIPSVVEIFDTEANYVLVKFQDGQKVFKALWEKGIILRDQHKALGLQNCIRISIGTREELERTVEAIGGV